MTEQEWLGCEDPEPMLELVQQKAMESVQGQVHDRQLRLFICACARMLWDLMTEPSWRSAVEMAEEYADGVGSKQKMREFSSAIEYAEFKRTSQLPYQPYLPSSVAMEALREYASAGARYVTTIVAGLVDGPPATADLLRDIIGNPFRPVPVIKRAWRTSTVRSLAKGMYESRGFGAMPILADALQDAGCDSDDILNHCRNPGPHARGCWAVDLVLGRE